MIPEDNGVEAWRDDAACLQTDPELFFPNPGETVKTRDALKVCNGNPKENKPECPVKAECLAWALRTNQPFAIAGGKTARQRREMRAGGGRKGSLYT